jgi:hypothetical protein
MSVQMKQLKSSYRDLRAMYDNIGAKHVLEPLKSRHAHDDSAVVRRYMEKPEVDFDVMGIKEKGKVYGYVERASLAGGPCGNYSRVFHPSELIAESASLPEVLSVLRSNPRIFVLRGTKVTGIVTRGDLQKAPVRMWIFGIITLIEMNLLSTIRTHYTDESWKKSITRARLEKATKLFKERKKHNEAIDLVDCLEVCDKADIVLGISRIRQRIKDGLGKDPRAVLDSMEKLRNIVAHAQDLIAGSSWTELIDLTRDLGKLLGIIEPSRNR